jgi:hypothetical protein
VSAACFVRQPATRYCYFLIGTQIYLSNVQENALPADAVPASVVAASVLAGQLSPAAPAPHRSPA